MYLFNLILLYFILMFINVNVCYKINVVNLEYNKWIFLSNFVFNIICIGGNFVWLEFIIFMFGFIFKWDLWLDWDIVSWLCFLDFWIWVIL